MSVFHLCVLLQVPVAVRAAAARVHHLAGARVRGAQVTRRVRGHHAPARAEQRHQKGGELVQATLNGTGVSRKCLYCGRGIVAWLQAERSGTVD